jgi:alpha-1,2-mannosyltransferase
MGIGYAYPFVKLFFGPKLYSYTHYPLVSYDMMRDVIAGKSQFNNREDIASSKFKSTIKKLYYVLLTYLYSFCGWVATDQIATNSTWTNNHIIELWRRPKNTQIIYPPVDTEALIEATKNLASPRKNLLISFAQFRPEKDHAMQLRMWKRIVKVLPKGAEFWLLGTVRDEDDQQIVEGLKRQAKQLGIEDSIDFKINRSRNEIVDIFKQAKVAIHTMRNEHFGIAVVELMSAGIVTIAHKSAGPFYDIIGGTTK